MLSFLLFYYFMRNVRFSFFEESIFQLSDNLFQVNFSRGNEQQVFFEKKLSLTSASKERSSRYNPKTSVIIVPPPHSVL